MVTLGKHAKYEIMEAIRLAEEHTTGEIRVHIKPRGGPETMKEAVKVFRKLGMHRTRERSGVLIFVALGSRSFTILGDEGIHQKVGDEFWNSARDTMSGLFSAGKRIEAIVAGVRCAGEKLKQHFPSVQDNPNELPNEVSQG